MIYHPFFGYFLAKVYDNDHTYSSDKDQYFAHI